MRRSNIGYMCTTDYDIELRAGADFPQIYKSLAALKADRKCWKECGVVKVEIILARETPRKVRGKK